MPRFVHVLGWLMIILCFHLSACEQTDKRTTARLTPAETLMPEAKYYSIDFADIPDEVLEGVALGPASQRKALPLEDINRLTERKDLKMENGYCLLEDGTAYVAVRTYFPGATKEMIHWWFWWHALKDIRYKVWCPGDHYAIGVNDRGRLTDENLSDQERYLNNPQYPVENIGSGRMRLSIRFLHPEIFGFDVSRFNQRGVAAVICGIVGFKIGQSVIEHTYMCHVFRETRNGLELRSRFWLGKKFNMPKLRKLIVTKELAVNMLLHCSKEYNHLAEFLPEIYDEFAYQG